MTSLHLPRMQHPTSPTPTQYALFLCFLVFGPAMGVMAGYLAHKRSRSAAFATLATTATSWGAWLVSCVCAAVMFPTYPASGTPSEAIAMLFVVPGFVAGGLALAWVHGRGERTSVGARSERIAGLVIALLAAVSAFALVELHIQGTTWPARRHLPSGAVVLREDILVDSFIGDHDYTMEARMTRAEFDEWMEDLALQCVDTSGVTRCRSASSSPDPTVINSHGKSGWYEGGVGHFHSFSS